jgi:hypothetical protein
MANDNRPYGITKLRELWPDKWAVGALFKAPSGGSLSFSTDLPKEHLEDDPRRRPGCVPRRATVQRKPGQRPRHHPRLYVNPNPCRRKTSLDPYLPALKKALGLGDGLYEYALVYFSW